MRILITSSLYPTPGAPKVIGGAEIFVRRIAEGLLQSGDTVEVVRAASLPEQPMETSGGIEVYSAPVRNIYRPFTGQRSAPARGLWHAMEDWSRSADLVASRIKAFRPDVLHSNNLSGLTPAVWKVAAELGVPVLHTLHDYYLTCPRCSRFSDGKTCEHTCMSCTLLTINRRKATRYLRGVVGVSQRILDIHLETGLFADTELRRVIAHASTMPVSAPTKGPAGPPLTFGFIGRLTEEKGIYNLVKAFADLPRDRVRLVIAGVAGAEIQHELRAMAPKAHIEFLGFVEPEQFYRQIDVVVIPPIWEEPGPLVVADAQAARKPFLGTRFGGIPEAVKRGAVGWLTAPDPKSLADSILRIIANPQELAKMFERLANKNDHRTFADVIDEYRDAFALLSRHPR
ncbi:glycosyltransferase family 4 protein [Bradyrhizobium sp. WYCCWR 13023]|uniref:Glycosyltransferase family 4 protein n=1 Tax=Bradyrhizobium zhengyangense TaxID=2911009 RepID=A0A9X1UBT3_9BRAD|nr:MULTISPECIES: glycosyltransferase family 4 protein [Bradyrhizobium]MCG2631531.1 glycosyltransferase family 4 protein [Bradyrhizobium zhengyangense]MCG2671391.1 glycosyltransferase family 4 protein [Bradyrhizobium zhengyangense]MDA9522838.1 glycosyl transferase [Bradyrhizobium sp. CCBAU 11434]